MLKALSLLTPLLGVALSAQNNYYIPDSNAATGNCNVIPFGSGVNSSFYQCKYQAKATVADLGSMAGIITGLGFAPCSSGASTFTHIEVVLDHHPASAPLSTTFAANLTANAVTVLSADNYNWHTTQHGWMEIGLQNLFVYNGVDDLVIQITSVDGVSPGGFHRGANQRVYWIAASGTAPATGSTDSAAGKFEVSMMTARASTYGVGCQGSNGVPAHSISGTPQLGTTIGIDVASGPPNLVGFAVFGFLNSSPPFPLDLTFAGLPGCLQYIAPVSSVAVPLDAAGAGSLPLSLPTDPSYTGVLIYSQYACLDPAANAAGATTSNYGRILIGL